MRIVALCTFLFFASQSIAQKVALVLSGGGAKGLAHVGVIKALEENNIPIDYIVGTSMGGIIGGCYAAGMSASEIEEMVVSEDFMRWVNGLPEKGYNYHYHKNGPEPHFIKLNLSLDSTFNFQFNTSIANDMSLNFALAHKMAKANAVAMNNFDSLFIPLRVVAADVFTQSEIILKSGVLSDALRATQTVPFFYNPIKVEGKYLFDGGLYNNFPVDVAMKEFAPDVVIGSNVSSKVFEDYPYQRDEKLIANSLLYMLLDKSDPSSIPDSGVYIQPNLGDYTSFDFDNARALVDSGYNQTVRQLNEIRKKVSTRRALDELNESRQRFLHRQPELQFDRLTFRSFSTSQRKFIQRIFKIRASRSREFSLGDIRRSYFKLVSEPYFSNIYPSILFNPESDKFTFQLTRRPRKNFSVDFGGVIATRNLSNIALGANYYYFKRALAHFQFEAQTGSFYKSLIAKARIDLPFYNSIFIEPGATYNNWDYLESEDLVQKTTQTVLKRVDRSAGVSIGWPLGSLFKMTIAGNGISNIDRYVNTKTFVSSDTLDELKLRGLRTDISISVDDLNRKQYASAGKAYYFTASFFDLNEEYTPGNTSTNAARKERHQWFRLRATAQHFFTNRGLFRIGYYADAVFSNQPFFRNYIGTIVNAPGFAPFQDSPTLLLENFRSFNYVAGGLRNIFSIRGRLDLRIEGYIFKPIDYILEGPNQEALSNEDLTSAYFAGTAGLVLHSPVGPISLSVNYYDDAQNQWGALLHVGFLLFNRHTVND